MNNVIVASSLERVVETIEAPSVVVTEAIDKPTIVVTGMIGPKGSSKISDSTDIDLTNLVNGATLVYSDSVQKWQATNLLENQIMNGGFF